MPPWTGHNAVYIPSSSSSICRRRPPPLLCRPSSRVSVFSPSPPPPRLAFSAISMELLQIRCVNEALLTSLSSLLLRLSSSSSFWVPPPPPPVASSAISTPRLLQISGSVARCCWFRWLPFPTKESNTNTIRKWEANTWTLSILKPKKKRGLNRNRDGRKEGEDRREIDNFLEREDERSTNLKKKKNRPEPSDLISSNGWRGDPCA